MRVFAPALTLTRRIDGPWLAIRGYTPARASEIVIAGDPRAPTMWRRLAAEEQVDAGLIGSTHLTPLSEFGITVRLYPHTRVLSVRRASISRARMAYGHGAGTVQRPWAGPCIDRIRIERCLIDLVREAVKDCNMAGVGAEIAPNA